MEQAARGTAGRVAGLHVLAIQDTTNFRDSGGGTGVVGHATIAVEAEAGALLGLAATQVIERCGGEKASKHAPLCDKQSRRWLDGMQESARLLEAGAARVTAVADQPPGRDARPGPVDHPALPQALDDRAAVPHRQDQGVRHRGDLHGDRPRSGSFAP